MDKIFDAFFNKHALTVLHDKIIDKSKNRLHKLHLIDNYCTSLK